MKKQLGFTLNEILVCVWALFCLCLAVGAIYAAIHFISKFW